MTRQYIGARYVPRFLGAYDATTIYDALDVVDNGLGTSYIAKKTVPAGTPLNDTDYWFVYGASSGAILDLQSRMSAAEGQISTNTADIAKKQNIQERIIFVGDSYAQSTSDAPTPYPEVVANILGLVLNDTYYVSYYGGASWKGLGGRPSFVSLLQAIEDDVTDPDSITKIIVCGGVNDAAGTISDIYSGASDFMTYAKTKYKNAKVLSGMIGWNVNNATRRTISQVSYPGYMNLGAFGIGVIDNAFMIMHDYRFFAADGTHPTQNGATYLGYMLASYILSGNAAANGYGEISTPVTLGSMFTSGSLAFKEMRTSDVISVGWNRVDLAFAANQSVGYDSMITIGTKESVYWLSDVNYMWDGAIEMNARLVYNDGNYQSRPVRMLVFNTNGTITAQILMDHDFNNVSNPVYLSIEAGSKTFNPMCV